MIGFIKAYPFIEMDSQYIQALEDVPSEQVPNWTPQRIERYLGNRPLLHLAPSKGNLDSRRLILANFIHANTTHLTLNVLGIFAGTRILSTFLTVPTILALFTIGGSFGLFISLVFTSESSNYIPHVGASAGIFALMGAYYVFNFRYRTRYFFWFPGRHGQIPLKTSWFFILDVIALELLLSISQFSNQRIDSVDHLSHVVGFLSGIALAILLRTLLKWPSYAHSRQEFLWMRFLKSRRVELQNLSNIQCWFSMLKINPQNDELKLRAGDYLVKHIKEVSDEQIKQIFSFLSPTFVRLHAEFVARYIRKCLENNRALPQRWLEHLPYDSVIYIAKFLAGPVEQQAYLYDFLNQYRQLHRKGPEIQKKIDTLAAKLLPTGNLANPNHTSSVSSSLRPIAENLTQETASKKSRNTP